MRGVAKLAARSLRGRGARYRVLLAALAFSSAAILVIATLLFGLVGALEEKAKVYYGGDLCVRGLEDGARVIVRDGAAIRGRLQAVLPPGTTVSRRYEHRDTGTYLYFGGEGVRQRILIGLDFRAEAELFSRMNYVAGSAAGMADTAGASGILISEPIARLLKAKAGDDLLLVIPTVEGKKNSAKVVVRGVFRDSSLFGYYTSYLDRGFLQDLVGLPEELCTTVSVFFPEGRPGKRVVAEAQATLAAEFPFVPMVERQKDFWEKAYAERVPGMRYALLTLGANLDEIRSLLEAVYAVAFILMGILTGLVFLGLSGSFRVIVDERAKEIGTLRAIGMRRGQAAALVAAEAAVLSLAGSCIGSLAAALAVRILGKVDLSSIPYLDIFLRGGKLETSVDPVLALALGAALALLACAATAGPAIRAARIDPAEAMRKEA